MTRSRLVLGPLGRWLSVAFTAVATGSVLLLTAAAAAAPATAYRDAGGWDRVNLTVAANTARAAGAQQLFVHDTSGAMVYPGRGRAGPGRGAQSGAATVSAPVRAARPVLAADAAPPRLTTIPAEGPDGSAAGPDP